MKRVPVSGPSITDREIAYVTEAVTCGWYENASLYQRRFEAAFARAVGRRHAVALPSCTSAIHLALLALDLGPGDEVIVPESTWIATAAPIDYVGATPIFADVDAATWCVSVASVKTLATPATRAIIPVDLYGGMPDMASLLRVAGERGIAVIEDAAEAAGSVFADRPAGSFGVASVFSFHGSKTLTTGEGGMLLTDDEDMAARVNVLQDHGREPGDVSFFNREVAHKYKMTAMQAALGLAQLERLDELVGRKREIFGWYRDRLGEVDGLQLNAEPPGTRNSYWMVTVIPSPEYGVAKGQLLERLRARGIDARPFFYPLSALPPYAARAQACGAADRNPNAYRLSETGVNLPSGLQLTEPVVDRVCAAFLDALHGR